MRDSESLIFGLLFLAVVGFQVFKQFLAARAEQQRRLEQARNNRGAPTAAPQPLDDEPDPFDLTETDWGRAPEPVPVLPPEVQPAPKSQAARPRDAVPAAARRPSADVLRRRARHRLFHSQRALRHGIVMMTVLGPCRAAQPYDRDI